MENNDFRSHYHSRLLFLFVYMLIQTYSICWLYNHINRDTVDKYSSNFGLKLDLTSNNGVHLPDHKPPRDENVPIFILKVQQRRHIIYSLKRNREDIYQISNHAFQDHYELESAIEKI